MQSAFCTKGGSQSRYLNRSLPRYIVTQNKYTTISLRRYVSKTPLAAKDEDSIWGEQMLSSDTDNSSLSWLEEQGNLLGEEAENEAEEEELAATVGIHVRGDSVFRDEKLRDERDDSRFHWHRMLHSFSERGDFENAENVIKQMNENNQLPGPKAYHALVFSYVKGGYAKGALNAIRNEVSKGIRPLPQTYAVILVGFLKEGDIDTALAVYASNRRAEIPFEGSWRALCSALFNVGDYDRAMQILKQGESEGLTPDIRMYDSMIESMCKQGDLSESIRRLKEMASSGLNPDKKVLSAVVTAHAAAGKVNEAEALLKALIHAPGTPSAMTIGSVNAVLQMYLNANLGKEELAERISTLRQLMIKGGMSLDRKGYSLLLEASVHLEDPKVGWLAFQSLQTQPRGSLQYIKDEVMADFLYELSLFGEPSKIDTVLCTMTTERRELSKHMMLVDDTGRTFVTRWLDQMESFGESRSNAISIDGITLDSDTLCALSDEGEPLAPTKMSVRELRAELAARQYPLRGNKKELIKQLQKARSEADLQGGAAAASKSSKAKKIDIIVAEESWNDGNLEAQNLYEDEREILPDDDDDDNNQDEVDFDEEPKKRKDDEDDDDDNFDYEDRVFSVMKARGKRLDFHENANFNHEEPGLHEAILLLRRVLAMDAQPSKPDLECLISSFTPETRHLAQELKDILDGKSVVLDGSLKSKIEETIKAV